MLRKNIYKSKKLKFKKSFKTLLLFILLAFITTGCFPKEKININEPLKVELIYPKTVSQSTLTDIKLKITNRGIYPIAITSIQLGQPRITLNFKGTTSLKALKHKFKKNKQFKRKYFLDKKIAKRREHVVPEVHKLKSIIYPGTTKMYTVKAIVQNIKKTNYKNHLSIVYINFDKKWHKKLYLLVGKTSPQKETLVDELYRISKELPSKLENNLVASSDLGKVKYKKFDINIKLTGWNFQGKKINAEEYLFLKEKNAWLYYSAGFTFLSYKNGKTEKIGQLNMLRIFNRAILKGKTKKLLIKNTESQYLKEEIKKYNFTLNGNSFEASIKKEQLNDFFDKIYSKGYAIHKYGNIIKVK